MRPEQIREAREALGWTQQEAARRLAVSQPYYSQLERGDRPISARLATVLLRVFRLSPVTLPLPALVVSLSVMPPADLAGALGALGYPGFVHLRQKRVRVNPAEVVVRALVHADLEPRLVEALPWVLAEFADLDWVWVVAQCRVLDLQNRLGYLVGLALELGREESVTPLRTAQGLLERSRLVVEDTLCRASMPEAERKWVRKWRPDAAAHWNLLTTLTVEQLTHAA